MSTILFDPEEYVGHEIERNGELILKILTAPKLEEIDGREQWVALANVYGVGLCFVALHVTVREQ